jgi:hypothetical protein
MVLLHLALSRRGSATHAIKTFSNTVAGLLQLAGEELQRDLQSLVNTTEDYVVLCTFAEELRGDLLSGLSLGLPYSDIAFFLKIS